MKRVLIALGILFLAWGLKPCTRYVFSPFYEEATISYGQLDNDGNPKCVDANPFLITYVNHGSRRSDYRWYRPTIRRPGHSDNLVQKLYRDDTLLAPGQSVSYCYKIEEVLTQVRTVDLPSLELSIEIIYARP